MHTHTKKKRIFVGTDPLYMDEDETPWANLKILNPLYIGHDEIPWANLRILKRENIR